MNEIISRIKLKVEGKKLLALYAIAAELKSCGKIGKIGFAPNRKEQQNFKLNDTDLVCLYKIIIQVLAGNRYPNKGGNEYFALCELKSI